MNAGVAPLRRLADCLDHLRVPKNSGERADMSGEVPYWGANSIQGWVNRALVQGPVVLIGEDGAPFFDSTRDVAFAVNGPLWPNNHVHVLRARAGVEPRYLAWCLNAVDYSLYVKGSTRDKLNQLELMSIELPWVRHEQQSAIANYLDRETAEIDAFIADQEELADLLAERRRALVAGAVADLDWAPRVPVGRLFHPSKAVDRGDLPMLSVYRDWGVVLKSSRSDNANKTPEDVSRYLHVQPGSLVVNKMKAWQGSIAVSSVEGIVSPDYEVARLQRPDVNFAYIHAVLRSPTFISQYRRRSVGIRPAQWRLYWEELSKVAVPLPPIEDQRKFIAVLDSSTSSVEEAIADAREAVALSKERRAALISAAVTGQIDVTEKKRVLV